MYFCLLQVVSKALRTVPYPLLGENTFVLSDVVILAPDEDGKLALMVRCKYFHMLSHPSRQFALHLLH